MHKKKRIGVDMHVFDGKYQGSRSHLVGLYVEALRRRPDLDFFFFLENCDLLAKVQGFDSPNAHFVRMKKSNPLWRLAVQLPLLSRKHDLDLLHLQYIAPLWSPVPTAVTIHDVLFEDFPEYFGKLFVLRSRLLMRRSSRTANLVCTVSEYSRGEMARIYGLDPTEIIVTTNAVDSSVFLPGDSGREVVVNRGLKTGDYLLTVGRIEPRKNHVNLLKAYKLLPPSPPPLVIVGQRDFGFGEFDAALSDMPPDRRVVILSDVADADLAVLYRHAKMFIYPSFAEGFGMPPLEAMASGVPVITSSSTALPEVVGSAGIQVDATDVSGLANAMTMLLSDSVLYERLAKQGLERAKEFSWSQSADRFLSAVDRRVFGSAGDFLKQCS